MAVDPRRVVSSHFPYVPVQITFGLHKQTVEALIDTGFDGDIVLPAGMIPAGVQPAGNLMWQLADDSEVTAPAYLALAQVGDFGSFRAVVTALGDEPIVGRNLTNRFKLTLDHGQNVVVE